MRSFPRTAAAVVAALGVISLYPLTSLADPDDDLEQKHDQLQGQIADTQQDLEHASAEAVAAAQALQSAEAKLSDAQTRLATARAELVKAEAFDQKMQAKLALSESQLTAAAMAVVHGEVVVDLQTENVRRIVTDQLQKGDSEMYAFLAILDSKTPEQLTTAVGVQDALIAKEASVFEDLETAKAQLEEQRAETEEVTAQVAADREAAAENLVKMAELESEAEAVTVEIKELVDTRADAEAAAVAAKEADQAKLNELEAERNKVAALLAAQSTDNDEPTGGSGGGTLMYPVNGNVTSPYGYRRHPIYGYWGLHDGIDFGAGCGAALYAATDGVVLTSYWSNVYGRRLVLNHGVRRGVNLASVYNHATSYTVGVGERVSRGQIIGYVGSTGWSTGCHLHYTVMVNGKTVDPMGWF